MNYDPEQVHHRAFDLALDALINRLKEAQAYLASDEYPGAAVGTLLDIDDLYDDMKAALRLYRNSRRKK